jgi:hypothetical protein
MVAMNQVKHPAGLCRHTGRQLIIKDFALIHIPCSLSLEDHNGPV